MRMAVLSGQGQDEPAAWPDGQAHGRTLGAGGVRRLPLAVRTGSRPIGEAVTLNWGVRPTGRWRGLPCPSPASHCRGCPQEELIGGDGVQAGVRRPHPGGSGRPAGRRACPACHGEVLECPPGGPGLGAGVDERSGAEACFPPPIGSTDEGGAGGSAGIGERLPSVGAGGPVGGLPAGGSSLGGADRLAVRESLGRPCRGEPNIMKPIGHIPLA
jgi:hypothetical protein